MADKLNISIVIHFCSPDESGSILDRRKRPSAMRDGLLSGLILIRQWDEQIVESISREFPTVTIVNKSNSPNVDLVGIDNIGGIDMLVERLYELGHRKIAFLGKCNEINWSLERYAGYLASMARHKLDFQKHWIVEFVPGYIGSQMTLVNDAIDFDQIHSLCCEGITAFVCSDNSRADMLYRWLTENGYRVPEDISITGFHGGITLLDSDYIMTVSFDNRVIGEAAVKALENKINSEASSRQQIVFSGSLHEGSSTASPPAASKVLAGGKVECLSAK